MLLWAAGYEIETIGEGSTLFYNEDFVCQKCQELLRRWSDQPWVYQQEDGSQSLLWCVKPPFDLLALSVHSFNKSWLP